MTEREEAHLAYGKVLKEAKKGGNLAVKAAMRELALRDLFFLGVYVLGEVHADNDWVFARTRDVMEDPFPLDIWPRGHFKTTIKTCWHPIQVILRDQDTCGCIFSITKPLAKTALRKIMDYFENCDLLKELFDDVLWAEPRKQSAKWSEDDGIRVKRKSTRREETLMCSGLVDALPTGMHFDHLWYDDVVTEQSVTSPDMMEKTTQRWEMSLALCSMKPGYYYAGTRYHYQDTYQAMIDRGAVKLRLFSATKDGTLEGEPWMLTREELAEKRKKMGMQTFASQMMGDPKMESTAGFQTGWLRYWPRERWDMFNIYVLVDPANEKKKTSDYTTIWVLGMGSDQNIYVVDCIRDRLSLAERTRALFKIVKDYKPRCVGYEKYGMQSDVQHIQIVMNENNFHFPIIELGGRAAKNDRIARLGPYFEQGRIWLPERLPYVQDDGRQVDLVSIFVNQEYIPHPFAAHDDMLDAMSRILDEKLMATFPDGDGPYDYKGLRGTRHSKVEGDPLDRWW